MANFFNTSPQYTKEKSSGSGTRAYTGQQKAALNFLYGLYSGTPPTLPTLDIAGMTPAEQAGQNTLSNWVGGPPSEGWQMGLDELKRTVGGDYLDITKTPWFEPIVKRVTEDMNTAANRMGRKFQMGGALSSGPAVSSLGRIVREGGENLAGTLAPYAEAERSRQFEGISQLSSYETNEILKRLGAIAGFGSLPRDIENMINQASYAQEMDQTMFPYNVQAPLALGVAGVSPYGTQTQTAASKQWLYPSEESQWSQLLAGKGNYNGLGLLMMLAGGGI
ncbi:MAG: hypothetical protein PHH26_00650 [Candidatus Thermoplasmatota archaeon]|nr:hypothetical protein [Candidatus Thermoplasmatota archaeon]